MGRTILGTDRAWQQKIQFEDEGTPIGTSGGVNIIDFVGTGVTATVVDGVLTVTVSGGGGGSGATEGGTWQFDTSTVAGDPGIHDFRFDSATLASVTNIYISESALNSLDASTMLGFLSVGNRIYIQQESAGTRAALFQISGTPVDNGTWFTIPVTVVDSGTLMQNNQQCLVFFLYTVSGGGASSNTYFPGGWG